MIEILANGHSSESTQKELSNEYMHDMVQMVFKLVLRSCAFDESVHNIHYCMGSSDYSTQPHSDFCLKRSRILPLPFSFKYFWPLYLVHFLKCLTNST